MGDEPHKEGHFIEMLHKYFCSTCNALCPSTDFFNRVHLSAIVSHVKCTFLDCFYIHLQLERAISVFILIFFTYFLSANVAHR